MTEPTEPIFQSEREALALRAAARATITTTEAKLAGVLETLKTTASASLVGERELLRAQLDVARAASQRVDAETGPACAAAERARCRSRLTQARDNEAAARAAVEADLARLADLRAELRDHIAAIETHVHEHAAAASRLNDAIDALAQYEPVKVERSAAFSSTYLHERRARVFRARFNYTQSGYAPPDKLSSWIALS